ncbi:hypothetical protein MASR2M39_14440 [Ignavibacteriales bacterium]
MFEGVFGPIIVGLLRVCDVSLGTLRTILVVQGKKYLAGFVGFFEAAIWVIAISQIFQYLNDNPWMILGYATGYGLGNVAGIWLEQQIGLGFVQVSVVSLQKSEEIAAELRSSSFGVTSIPAVGLTGGTNIIMSVVDRKKMKGLINLVESIDPKAFISVQSSLPYRGYRPGARI